jgi:dTDP-4-dehydrorhamnose reductase
MKILITGCRGQLGSQLIDILNKGVSELGPISEEYKKAEIIAAGSQELDITDFEAVKQFLFETKPDIIINCAAYTNVYGCESNEDLAYKVNAAGPKNLAVAGEEIGAKIVHISTDYVFEGRGKVPYRENDAVNPISAYGKTKLAGENFIKEFSSKYFIIRTAWLYGYYGNNFVKTIIKAGREKGHLDIVNDQRGNPTNAEDLIYHVLKLALTEKYGIYNCTGKGECTWYDFGKAAIDFSNISCIVTPISSGVINRKARRPSFSSLDNTKLRDAIGYEMRDWKQALKCFVECCK